MSQFQDLIDHSQKFEFYSITLNSHELNPSLGCWVQMTDCCVQRLCKLSFFKGLLKQLLP